MDALWSHHTLRLGSVRRVEKAGAVIGVSNLHIYAAMRGQSLADFQKTRNAPGALYSLAGKRSSAGFS